MRLMTEKIKEKIVELESKDIVVSANGSNACDMVIELLAGLGVGVAVGYSADCSFGTLPIFLFICTIFGLLAGFYNFYKRENK